MDKEKRFNQVAGLQVRDGTQREDVRKISGYPIVFNKRSGDLGGFVEIIDPHALDDLDLSDLMLVYGHEINQILARSSAGNLKVSIDKTGLFFEATLPNTSFADDVLENIRVGNIAGMSFMFSTDAVQWDSSGDIEVRTIKHIDWLPEITITPFPAYPDTSVATNQRDSRRKQYREKRTKIWQAQLDLVRLRQGGKS